MVSSLTWYLGLLCVIGCERVVELRLSRAHAQAAFARGGVEFGQGHYPWMVLLHTGLLVGAAVEPVLAHRAFAAWIGWPALGVVIAAQGLRWWAVWTLGARWNTRVIVVPGDTRVTHGPYRFWAHPNYAAVIAEGLALPLIHSAWVTALSFTLLNAALLRVRMRVEDAALAPLRTPAPGGTRA